MIINGHSYANSDFVGTNGRGYAAIDPQTGLNRFPDGIFTDMLAALSAIQALANYRLIANGGFALAQRQAPGTLTTYSNTSGRSYGADRWGMTNENASIQYQRIDTSGAVESGLLARHYGKFKKLTSTGKMIVSQVLEGSDSAPLRGLNVRVQVKMKRTVAAAMTVRLGLLQLAQAGTIDSIPATFASAFGANSVDPTWGTNLAAIAPVAGQTPENASIVGNFLTCVVTGSWLRFGGYFLVPSDLKNLVLVAFTDSQAVANDELNMTEAQICLGTDIQAWTPPALDAEIARCQRFFSKSFPIDSAPATNFGVAGALRFQAGKAGALAEIAQIELPVRMRIAPATMTLYNPSVANVQVRDVTGAVDCSASAVANPGELYVDVNTTGNAATAVGNELKVHWTADGAEL